MRVNAELTKNDLKSPLLSFSIQINKIKNIKINHVILFILKALIYLCKETKPNTTEQHG